MGPFFSQEGICFGIPPISYSEERGERTDTQREGETSGRCIAYRDPKGQGGKKEGKHVPAVFG